MSDNTYAAILAALAHGTTVTYGGLTRGERMHVQSMRRDGLAVVLDPSGAVLDSLDGDPASKRAWTVRVTERGRACASALAPFATGAPVIGRAPRHAAPVETSTSSVPAPGTCGQVTRKGTPCQVQVGPTGACKVHGSPVTVTRVEAPAPVVEAAPALDLAALAAALAPLLAGAR